MHLGGATLCQNLRHTSSAAKRALLKVADGRLMPFSKELSI